MVLDGINQRKNSMICHLAYLRCLGLHSIQLLQKSKLNFRSIFQLVRGNDEQQRSQSVVDEPNRIAQPIKHTVPRENDVVRWLAYVANILLVPSYESFLKDQQFLCLPAKKFQIFQ